MKTPNNSKMSKEVQEPVSPTARLMASKEINACVVSVVGYKSKIDASLYKRSVEQTLLKHPRFRSILTKNKGKYSWKRTNVDVDDHITAPDLDPNMENSDEFVEEFSMNLSKTPLDMTRPPWEIYILNVKTSDANAIAVMRLHHAMGDGVSLMALCHACARKISDPDQSLRVVNPTPSKKEKHVREKAGLMKRLFVLVWTLFAIVFNTLVDCTLFVATILFLKDKKTPIKAAGDALPYKRFVHRIVKLDDVKLVKNAMNVSFNDVVLGVTEAGLSRYLNTRYEIQRENGAKITKKRPNYLPRNLHLRSAVVFNLRPSPTIEDLEEMMEKEALNGMWGNVIGIVLLPLTIDMPDDPLTHIRRAKCNMDKKKLSLGHKCAFVVMKLMMFFLGIKAAATVTRAIFSNTTLTFSSICGPTEEVNLFGHPVAYMAPSVYGFPQSLMVHFQSYADMIMISIGADEKLIPNPLQLCDDLAESLQTIKEAVIKRGLVNGNASQLC